MGRIFICAQGLSLQFFRSLLPWSHRFFLILLCMREPRSGEQESRSGEKEKPQVTLDLNLTFMQTLESGSDPRPRIG